MGGGTWDYDEKRLAWLADEIRSGRYRHDPDTDGELGFERARNAMADMLDAMHELLRDLDRHFADDGVIPDEDAWLVQAWNRMLQAMPDIR